MATAGFVVTGATGGATGVTGASATQVPLPASRWVAAGHLHWVERLRRPQGSVEGWGAARGAGAGADGGVATGFATHWPLRISCQGKHCKSEDESSFACARAGSDELNTIKKKAIAAMAKKRVMTKP
jgi:hypothetical protein